MMHKAFQILLVTFVVIFTAVGLVLLVYGITPLLFYAFGVNGVGTFSFAVSSRVLKLALAFVLFLLVAGSYLITRRKKLR